MKVVSAILLLGILCATMRSDAATIQLVAGGGDGADGSPAANAKLVLPFGVDFDRAGNLYFCEMTGGERIRMIDPQGALTTIAGTGVKGDSGDGGPALKAQVNGPHNLIMGADGHLYIADTWNNRVRKIDLKTGIISTFAGTGKKGFSGDGGPAAQAQFSGVFCIAFDADGKTMYIDDLDNRRIRAIDMKTGIVNTIAGNGLKGLPKDGDMAKDSPLSDPRAVAADGKGNVYILERSGNALRVVDAAGKIKTLVGTGKAGGVSDTDGLKATLRGPKHLAIDLQGSILIADTDNHAIRRYNPADGKITTIAGTGVKGSTGLGGAPASAQLNQPHGIMVHPSGVLYISDSYNNRVLKIEK